MMSISELFNNREAIFNKHQICDRQLKRPKDSTISPIKLTLHSPSFRSSSFLLVVLAAEFAPYVKFLGGLRDVSIEVLYKIIMVYKLPGLLALLGLTSTAHAVNLTVSTAPGNATSPILYGLLYEVCTTSSLAGRVENNYS